MQVALDVRAEFIRFSPFGRTDRPEGGQYGQTQPNAQRAPQTQHAGAMLGEFPEGHVDEDVPF